MNAVAITLTARLERPTLSKRAHPRPWNKCIL